MAISIPIISEFDGSGIRKARQEFKQLEGAGAKAGYAIKKAAVPATAALGGMFAGLIGAAKGAEDARRANQRLGSVLESMGYAQQTERVAAYAEELEKTIAVDADVIKATQTKLATFAGLTKTVNKAGGAFDRATMAALNMAAAGFGTAEGNAVQLGKALDNPIKGIAALAKSGVTFTEQEKEKIKALTESGKLLEAQDMVLAAIEKQVGNTAAESASSFDKMKFAVAGVSDTFGEMMLPVIDGLAPKLAAFSKWAQENPGLLKALTIGIGATAAAVIALNVAMSLNPFALVALGIGALITAIAVAYQRFEGFRNVVKTVVNGVLTYFETVANAWIKTANLIIRGMNIIKPGKDIPYIPQVGFGRIGESAGGGRGSSVPMMADGGIVNSATLAVIGEAGPEAVIPLNRLGSMTSGGGVTINVHGGDPQAVVDALTRWYRQNGALPVAVSF